MKLLAFLVLLHLPFNHDDWELKRDKDGILIYTKHIEGSDLKAIKAETTFNASLETCAAVLRDIDNLTNLFPDTKVAKKLSQTATDQVHYLQIDAPWPAADRDGAFHLTYSYDASSQTLVVDAKTVPDAYPIQDKYVRLSAGGGTWTFTRISENQTKLDYYFHGEPGGSIPDWLANSVVVENPLRLIQNFHKLVTLDRYQGKSFEFLK